MAGLLEEVGVAMSVPMLLVGFLVLSVVTAAALAKWFRWLRDA